MNKVKLYNHYRYIVELDVPVKPRYFAADIARMPGYGDHLVRVTDLQIDTHPYGRTYEYRAVKRAVARTTRNTREGSWWKLLGKEFLRRLKLFI